MIIFLLLLSLQHTYDNISINYRIITAPQDKSMDWLANNYVSKQTAEEE